MTLTAETWLTALAQKFPELDTVVEAEGHPMPPVIAFAALSEWLAEVAGRGDAPTLSAVLQQLNEAYGYFDSRTRSLVANALVAKLPWPGEPGSGAIAYLEPTLRAEYEDSHRHGTTVTEWIEQLIQALPVLTPIYSDHLAAYDELLPALLLGAFVQWMESAVASGDPELPHALLTRIEHDYPLLDSNAQKLVRDAVVWMLPINNEPGSTEIRGWLGPTLRRLYDNSHVL
jgi:hypothetical protein